jgi:hypothetical protein
LKDASSRVRELEEQMASVAHTASKSKSLQDETSHTLTWTQNKLQVESDKVVELSDQLQKTTQKLKEVYFSSGFWLLILHRRARSDSRFGLNTQSLCSN